MPMFPLGTVVMPGGFLPLHVFEPRYRSLVADVLDGDGRFGTVLIERGAEVGGGDQRFNVGTVVEVVNALHQPDGRWALVAVGRQRMVIERWLAEEPYPRGSVQLDTAALVRPQPALLAEAETFVRRAVTLHAELTGSGPGRARDPLPAGEDAVWYLADLAPLGDLDRQRVLEAPDADSRLRLLADLARECADMLAQRLGEG